MNAVFLRLTMPMAGDRTERLLLEVGNDVESIQGNGEGCIITMRNRNSYLVTDSLESIEERLQQVFKVTGQLAFVRDFDPAKPTGVFETEKQHTERVHFDRRVPREPWEH